MIRVDNLRRPPKRWSLPCVSSEVRLHQLAPYIGKLKSSIAEELLRKYTLSSQHVLDPFCGSGTIPVEAARLGRRVTAADISDYAVVLTRGKLEAPAEFHEAEDALNAALEASKSRSVDLRRVPSWVREFFHRETLREAIQLADELIHRDQPFLLSCLLGILHHQRPGFLSFPSSHLVPYRRTSLFPEDRYPELYTYRDVASRIRAKVQRAYKIPAIWPANSDRTSARVLQCGVSELQLSERVDAIVTSPPYMNALDYQRDNRLRLWFLLREKLAPQEMTRRREDFDKLVDDFACLARRVRPGGACVLIVGEATLRSKVRAHPADDFVRALCGSNGGYQFVEGYRDTIPDVRRSRRGHAATKHEAVVVLRRI